MEDRNKQKDFTHAQTSSDLEEQERILQYYKYFIVNCTSKGKSIKNYTDFKRINECIEALEINSHKTIFDFASPYSLEEAIKLLNNLPLYIEYNKKGNNQYSSTVLTYLQFLYALQLSEQAVDEKNQPYTSTFPPVQPHQQIFYGAPGTGKSHTIKVATEACPKENVVRTTFHPDSDYSTFVGAYKPAMQELPRYNPQTGERMGKEKKIVYAYTPQAFLKAYVKAWQVPEEPVFLIIEEINRGNCAQIFGDLFQLLDREEGISEYPIKADQDMQQYLTEALSGCEGLDEKIRSGEELQLPSNLYIWATMNTSDQSLFPIDSAFKRRWEWKYIPITQGKDRETGKLMQWSIEAEGMSYDWWSFLEVMNKRVGDITSSEDKKLGFFFCKADGQGIISADKFVSKVMFYLWNDVFKDYPDNPIAMYLKEEGGEFTYGDFYTTNAGSDVVVREELVTRLLDALGVKKVEAASNDDGEYTSNSNPTTDVKSPTDTQKAYYNFWKGLIDYGTKNSDYIQFFGRRTTPSYDKWFSYAIDLPNTALCVDLTRSRKELAVKIVPQRSAFEMMQKKQDEVNEKFDEQLVWNPKEGKKEAEIAIVWNIDDFSGIHNDSMYEKVVGYMLKMRQVFCDMFSQK